MTVSNVSSKAIKPVVTKFYMRNSRAKGKTYGENLIARCSQVHDNFTMGVNWKILINLIYLFIQETYLTCANGL